MTAKDRAIVARWKGRLVVRKRLLANARAAWRRKPNSPSAVAKVRERERQVQEAERVIKRHTYATGVASPVKETGHSWGWHPGVHDGVDLICGPEAKIYALCDAKVIDVRSSGWWGKGAQASSGHPISDGDGIIQLECMIDIGPFRKGMHFGYGHAEGAVVKVGQMVRAGQHIGHAGFANAWHVHFMVNGGSTMRGVGDRDPWPFVAYAENASKR
jgi:murein DD-endopeptidase MepM/ murein hydrolase activator NlpD